MPNRNWSGTDYRFGFNGQEKDNEIYGEGKSYTAEFWQYDSRLGRRWNLDPKGEASISLYACFGDNPIMFSDILGNTIRNGYKYLIDRTEKLITQTGNAKNYYETQYGLSEDMSKKEYIAGGGKRKTWTEYRKTLSSLHGYQKDLAYYNERFEVTQKIIGKWAKKSDFRGGHGRYDESGKVANKYGHLKGNKPLSPIL